MRPRYLAAPLPCLRVNQLAVGGDSPRLRVQRLLRRERRGRVIGYRICSRLLGHWWKRRERGIYVCRICRCGEIREDASEGAVTRFLLGDAKDESAA